MFYLLGFSFFLLLSCLSSSSYILGISPMRNLAYEYSLSSTEPLHTGWRLTLACGQTRFSSRQCGCLHASFVSPEELGENNPNTVQTTAVSPPMLCSPSVFSLSFIVSDLTLKPLIPLELAVCGCARAHWHPGACGYVGSQCLSHFIYLARLSINQNSPQMQRDKGVQRVLVSRELLSHLPHTLSPSSPKHPTHLTKQ